MSMGATDVAVPKNWEGPEWIEIDGQMLPFIRVHCCKEWLVCSVYSWGRCKVCGVRPE